MIILGLHTGSIGGIFITGIFGNFYTKRGRGIFDFQNGNSRWPCLPFPGSFQNAHYALKCATGTRNATKSFAVDRLCWGSLRSRSHNWRVDSGHPFPSPGTPSADSSGFSMIHQHHSYRLEFFCSHPVRLILIEGVVYSRIIISFFSIRMMSFLMFLTSQISIHCFIMCVY